MDRLDIRPGVRALAAEHWNWMQDSPRRALAGALSNLTELSPSYYISGCEVSVATVGPNEQYTVTDGWVCFKGEVMPVVAQVILKGTLQQVYFVVEDMGVDTIPVPDLNGVQYEVMRRRRAKLQVSNVLPTDYMAVNAPRQEDLVLMRLKGRVVPQGSILPYFGPTTAFDTTGLGINAMQGWAICNGLNGTPDMRGMVPFGATNVPDSGAPGMYSGVVNASSKGDKVGADSLVLTEDQLPEHRHELGMPSGSYIGASGGAIGTAAGSGNAAETFPTETQATGAGDPLDVRQPSLAVVFIMSIA